MLVAHALPKNFWKDGFRENKYGHHAIRRYSIFVPTGYVKFWGGIETGLHGFQFGGSD
jgi:hypothetical protein